MAQRQVKARDKTYLSEYTMNLKGPVQSGAQFPSEFRMAFAANKVAIQVETKNRDAKNYGRFEIVVPLMSAMGVLCMIDRLIKDKSATKLAYNVKDFVYFGPGKKSDSPMKKGTLTVGRDQDGVLFMGMSGKDITPIKFVFSLPAYDDLTDDQGNPFNAATQSEFAAVVFYETYKAILPPIMALHYAEPEKKDGGNGGGNGGGGYGGGNRGGNGGGNGGNGGGGSWGGGGGNSGGGDAGFSEDIPF